jgi:hypothetical protein
MKKVKQTDTFLMKITPEFKKQLKEYCKKQKITVSGLIKSLLKKEINATSTSR